MFNFISIFLLQFEVLYWKWTINYNKWTENGHASYEKQAVTKLVHKGGGNIERKV